MVVGDSPRYPNNEGRSSRSSAPSFHAGPAYGLKFSLLYVEGNEDESDGSGRSWYASSSESEGSSRPRRKAAGLRSHPSRNEIRFRDILGVIP